MRGRPQVRQGVIGSTLASAVAFAVAWTLTHDFVASTLIGATSPEQLDDSLAGADAVIPSEALTACDRISREIRYPLG